MNRRWRCLALLLLTGLTRMLRLPRAKAKPLRTAKVHPALAERPVGADLSLDGLTSNLGRSLDRASRSLGSLLDAAVGETGKRDISCYQAV